MLKKRLIPVLIIAVSLGACGAQGKNIGDAKSMESIQAEQGVPVRTRTISESDFSIYLKFPTVLRAKAESTAYAALSDVVRSVPVKVGDHVVRDQVVLSFSFDNPQYQQAKLSYENAKAAYERTKALLNDSGISKQDFDNSQTQYELARASYKQISDVVEVKAPIEGYITRLNVRATENVSPGTPLFTVSNQEGIEARFYVSADEIEEIKVGARARITTKGGDIEGSVSEVSLIMDPDHKSFPATAFFSGHSRNLVSGMNLDVAVETYRNERAIVVERKELSRSGDSWAAYVVANGEAQRRDVTVGQERGLELEIIGGLRVGDSLIASGTQNIYDGVAVKVVETVAGR